jgi:hypothetical protein
MTNKIAYLLEKKAYIQNKIDYCISVGRDTEYHANKMQYIESKLAYHGYEDVAE